MTEDQAVEERCSSDLMVATVFRDEAPFLAEWIEFHRLVGVQRFVLVDDGSADDPAAVLAPYVQAGVVVHLRCPCPQRQRGTRWTGYQRAVLEAVCRDLVGVTRWLALLDADEFLVPIGADDLRCVLRAYEDRGGVHVGWEPFGTSGVARLAPGDLVTDRLRWKAGTDALGKSVVKPHRVARVDIHRCDLAERYAYAEGRPVDGRVGLELHHYWTRDAEHLVLRKLPRAAEVRGWHVDDVVVNHFLRAWHDVRDDCMDRFLPELRRRLTAAR